MRGARAWYHVWGMPYVDLHSHLLPGLDDGAATLEETAPTTPAAWTREGVHDVACTSHIKRAHFPRIDIHELGGLRDELQRAHRRRGPATSRLHPGGELAHEDALELDDRELRADRPGPGARAVAAARVPVRGPRRRLRRRRRAPHRASATACCSPTRSATTASSSRLRAARRGRRAAAGQRLLAARRPRPARAADRRAAGAERPRLLPRLRHPPRHPRARCSRSADDALRRLGVSDVQAFRLTQSNPRFLLREGNPRLALPTQRIAPTAPR